MYTSGGFWISPIVSILPLRPLFFKHGHDAHGRAVGSLERQRQRGEAEGYFEGELAQSAQVLHNDHAAAENYLMYRALLAFDGVDRYRVHADPFAVSYTHLLHACSGADLLVRNRVEILINGAETFPTMEAAIAGAEKFIHMEFFIIRDDDLGRRIGGMLMEAARRGVKVRVLYDCLLYTSSCRRA